MAKKEYPEESDVFLKEIRLALSPNNSHGRILSNRTVFRYRAEDYLYGDLYVHNHLFRRRSWKATLQIELLRKDGTVIQEMDYKMSMDEMKSESCISLSLHDFPVGWWASGAGAFAVRVSCDERRLMLREFELTDLPPFAIDCLELQDFGLFRINKDASQPCRSQNVFNKKELEAIIPVLRFKDLLPESANYEIEICLFEQTGRLKECVIQQRSEKENDEMGYSGHQYAFGVAELGYWQPGDYSFELFFMGELIVSAPFTIGDQDIESVYTKDFIQPKKLHTGKNVLPTDKVARSPLELLNEMIGLAEVKKKVLDFSHLVQLDRQRKKAGLPVEKRSLHTVFIGNPGTGKTTVAKLMGKIFHEMGLLSKGHVVVAERATLTGQFYSSEHEKTTRALEQAQGGILFIDEAYTLYNPNDPKDPGFRVLETLFTAMSDEKNRDWMLILSGYPREMDILLNANPGLESRLPLNNRYRFDDYSIDELMQIADRYGRRNQYQFTADAHIAFRSVLQKAYSSKDRSFGNARLVEELLSLEVLPALAGRISRMAEPTAEQLSTIEKEDIPDHYSDHYDLSISKLQQMVGLSQLKKRIEDHLNFVKLIKLRQEQGLYTETPPMHMIFTGNPGTGKTTVADFLGEIYASFGLLSKGDVIRVERADLVGAFIGETERRTQAVLKQAKGNVLFIDEAYTLYTGGKENDNKQDYGQRAMETLLTTLSREHIDMLVILAGYPKEMEQMLNSNPGIRSRFPYTFHFEDYSVEELMEIARYAAEKSGYVFSASAQKALQALIEKELRTKDAHFGNARYVTRLISTQIIPAMAGRLAALPPEKLKNTKVLQTIKPEDIPITAAELRTAENYGFDEPLIEEALQRLDQMIGLAKVKQAIRHFVDVSRYLHRQGRASSVPVPLKWSFTGNTGTGKSTVAAILADILKAMSLLGKGHFVELKAEAIYDIPEYKIDDVLKEIMKRSSQGLLFVDGDAPHFKNPESRFDSEKLRIKLSSLTAELPGSYALVIAEHESIRQPLAKSLIESGVPSFDNNLIFDDYTAEELFLILEQQLSAEQLSFHPEARISIEDYLQGLCQTRKLGFANARTMKLMAQSIARITFLRAAQSPHNATLILPEDVQAFVWRGLSVRPEVGFRGKKEV